MKSRSGSKPKSRVKSKTRQKRRSSRRARTGLSPIPPGFGTVTPYLAIEGAARALEFYKNAFGARELTRQATPDGKIIHAQVKIGDSIVMLSDIFPGSPAKSPIELGTTPVTLHVYSRDVDELWNRAVAAGARVLAPLDNTFWGERYGQLVDPFGHRWSLSMRIKMSKEEMEAKQKASMATFAQNQHAQREGGQQSTAQPDG